VIFRALSKGLLRGSPFLLSACVAFAGVSGNGLAGTPQAVDLNRIASPPARTDVPPFGPAQRDDIPPSARWFNRITVE
jgi:hypothetical protein